MTVLDFEENIFWFSIQKSRPEKNRIEMRKLSRGMQMCLEQRYKDRANSPD